MSPEGPVENLINSDALALTDRHWLWPALARHVAQVWGPKDRALLEDLAAHPEQQPAPISWALRYYVRGDVVLRDGEVVTMDEICDELHVPHLPLLDDTPPAHNPSPGESARHRTKHRR